jgi:hypothetical protein
MLSTLTRRALSPTRYALMLGALIAVASCSDSNDPNSGCGGDPPAVARARLVFATPPSGAQQEFVFNNSAGETRNVTIATTQLLGSPTLYIYWLREDGTVDPNACENGEYRLRAVAPAGSGIVIEQNVATQPFGIIIKAASPTTGSVPVTLELIRQSDSQVFFGPMTVNITAQ